MMPFSLEVQQIVDSIYPPARQAIATQLSSLEIKIFFASAVLQLALLFGFYYTGWSSRAYAWYGRLLKNRMLTTVVFLMKVWGGFAILMLPLDWYAGFTVPHKYGLSLETPATWFHDWIVSWLVTLVVFLVIAVPFGPLVRRLGQRWPLVAIAVAAPLIVFGNAIFPAYVAPLFNAYTPLPPSPLTKSILDLAARQGISASAVYEYNMSLQTTEGNAYVSGLGPTARIAVGDNLLKDLKTDEVLYVVAHEMGHYKLHHIWWGSLYGWLGSIVAIVFLALAGGAIVRRGAPKLSRGLDDPAATPMLAGLLLAFALVTAPVTNGISRGIEHAADVFAAQNVHIDHAGVRAFARLGSEGLSVVHPSPIVVWYFYTHPPLDERIAYAAAAGK